MGAKDSKRSCLSYEDAVKRMSDVEFKRVCEAFKRLTGGGQLLSRHAFTQNVLGDGVPIMISEWLYTACGGGPRGIALRDLICGLVLLTKGTQEEKIRFLWSLYSNDSGNNLSRVEFQNALQIEGTFTANGTEKSNASWDRSVISLFGVGQDKVGFEHFRAWIQYNKEATVLSKWLLSNSCVTLSSELETPTFYQTLAGVTHLEEQDIGELEKCFWSLTSSSPSGQLDLRCISSLVSPPVPSMACLGLFLALDVNGDGHVDFKELCCGISAACRGPAAERMKFCFKIFDLDQDGNLNPKELQHMIDILLFIAKENKVYCNVQNRHTFSTLERKNVVKRGRGSLSSFSAVLNQDQNASQSETAISNSLGQERTSSNQSLSEKLSQNYVQNELSSQANVVEPVNELSNGDVESETSVSQTSMNNSFDFVYQNLDESHVKSMEDLKTKLTPVGSLSQEDFLIWGVNDNPLISPLLELLFEVCHVSLGLKPECRHHEYEIVMGWLSREECRGYRVGQFWYLISSDWWQSWLNYTTASRSIYECSCRVEHRQVEEGIVCDESFTSTSTDYTSSHSNEFTSNTTDSMGDLLSRGDSCSIASSSGVSSSSGSGSKRNQGAPGPIDNSSLVAEPLAKVGTLTGEGGRLKRDMTLVQHRDFELVPDSLWKALSLWYGGPLPLPRQVIRPPDSSEVELELYPLNLKILRHQSGQQAGSSTTWSSVVGGYGAAALSTAGITTTPVTSPRRYLAHTAAFSRLANVRQVIEFLSVRLNLRIEDIRLWHIRESTNLLDDEYATLQQLGISDSDQILLEVRNKDLTWPEELGALASGVGGSHGLISLDRRPTITLPAGATGLHNLGNTCFMNAALQAVSNTRPLTQYFQRDLQLCELNSSNPLGTRGQVARRYAELCRELWAGSTRSVAPLKLRWCVTKHAPHLGGGGQHDSQELLAWLLDALHEDLNRVTKKQYTELRDSDGRADTVVAEEAWQQHLARDHSIITDLFYGQLKSKVTCQTCGHESVRFDPFNLLSLPLPMESYILCEVLVVRLNGDTPVKYGLRLNSEAKFLELKQQLHALCDIQPDRLLLAEIACSQIKQIMTDDARINPVTATELYAYELPCLGYGCHCDNLCVDIEQENMEIVLSQSPLARSPESSNAKAHHNSENLASNASDAIDIIKSSVCERPTGNGIYTDNPTKSPTYFIAVHRKCVRQETYFLSQHKSKPSLFGVPLLLGCGSNSTCQSIYETVWSQVTRLLSPLPQSDQTNHATDCDDSLGYEFPFTLKAVLQGGQICALCHWTQFCRGCSLPCSDDLLFDVCRSGRNAMCIAIDWDPTALHLRYQSSREKIWFEHDSVGTCRKLHTEPIDIDYCLKAFTSEERLETKYHCSKCQDKQPATKKLQIWRLPPILIIHLKRFDYVNNKWVKTQKVVNFPFKDFDPTAYLASVPQETIVRHRLLHEQQPSNNLELQNNDTQIVNKDRETDDGGIKVERIPSIPIDDSSRLFNGLGDTSMNNSFSGQSSETSELLSETTRLVDEDDTNAERVRQTKAAAVASKIRERLISTSLQKTPIVDEDLCDFHEHKLIDGQDPFDLKYQLYAVVSHSGLLNGGHYISYACNPNGHWYCYNDSSCREVPADDPANTKGHANIESNNNEYKYGNKYNFKSFNSSANVTPLSRRKNYDQTKCSESHISVDNSSEDSEVYGTLNGDKCDRVRTSNNSLSIPSRKSSTSSDKFKGHGSPLPRKSLKSVSSAPRFQSYDFDSANWEVDRKVATNTTVYESKSSLSNFKCAYSDVKTPKMDTSTAYILFYERSGLDYKPYLPDIVVNGQTVAEVELEESESELRKQLCSIQ